MNNRLTKKAMSLFESIKHVDESGNEYWTSRAMWKILAYTEYRHFLPVIEKAKVACRNSGQRIEDHFEDILEMVGGGSGAKRPVESVKLSRYACYLIVQNSDPNKTIVAQGQTYFAIQTRIAEVQQMAAYQELSSEEEKRLFLRAEMLKHNSLLASVAKDAGVIDAKDYAVFQNWGYQGLYGGMTAKDIHYRKGLKKTQKILDHMGSTENLRRIFFGQLKQKKNYAGKTSEENNAQIRRIMKSEQKSVKPSKISAVRCRKICHPRKASRP